MPATASACVRTLTAVYLGGIEFRQAVADRSLVLVGSPDLMRDAHRWFARSRFADTVPATEQERRMPARMGVDHEASQ